MPFQPQVNTMYHIQNKNSQQVIIVAGGSTSNGQKLVQNPPSTPDDQKWIIFALDGGLSAIANRKSGYVAVVENASTNNGARVIQHSFHNNPGNEKWSFTNNSDPYIIVGHESGKYIVVKDASTVSGADIIIWSGGGSNHLWSFQPVGTFSLPAAPSVEPLPDIPRFTGPGQNLPDLTQPVVIAYTYLPCIMVTDTWGIALKINETPYYLLKKQEYWEKVFQQDIPAHGSIEKEEVWGMRTTEQRAMEQTTGITVGMDAGFSFKGASASISTQVTQELKVTQSVTTEVMQEYRTTYTYNNPTETNTSYAKYQRVVEYLLSRTNGTQISSAWAVKKEQDTRMTTWPANAPMSEQQVSTVTMSDG